VGFSGYPVADRAVTDGPFVTGRLQLLVHPVGQCALLEGVFGHVGLQPEISFHALTVAA
jgi:hypothetical protein